MGLMIRWLQPEDLTQLVALCADHAAYEKLDYVPDNQAERLQQAVFGEPARLYVWVVADGPQLRGYLSATLDYSTWSAAPFAYMDCLYLQEPMRGQGWGRKLLATLAAFAGEHGCRQIQWQTPPDNLSGIGFYQAIGAQSLPKSRFHLNQGVGLWER
ncbi:N-acetyltransferase family protein [Cronobacter dublinensis]